jgi:hypothetical protein
MPVEIFDHDRIAISRELPKADSRHQHYYGGSAEQYGLRFRNADPPCHVVYMLDTADELVTIKLPGVRFVPLVHGFQYSSNGGDFLYRMLNEKEIEVIAPAPPEFNPDFPYSDYPSHFPQSAVSFEQRLHDQTTAESALEYQGVFGIDQLSKTEMNRAVAIARSTWHTEYFEDNDWSDEESVVIYGCAPFMQTKPATHCNNPNCTAEIVRTVEASEIELPPDETGILSESTLKIDEYVIRAPTLDVIAIHQPSEGDETLWDWTGVQLIWQLCSVCGCITVNNQCD